MQCYTDGRVEEQLVSNKWQILTHKLLEKTMKKTGKKHSDLCVHVDPLFAGRTVGPAVAPVLDQGHVAANVLVEAPCIH